MRRLLNKFNKAIKRKSKTMEGLASGQYAVTRATSFPADEGPSKSSSTIAMRLPVEIIRDICDMLYEDCDLKTLSVLSRTCRFLNATTIPIVYSKIGIQFSCRDNPDDPDLLLRATTLFPVFDPPLCHYFSLNVKRRNDKLPLKKIFEDPENERYAHYVRSLSVNLWCCGRCETSGMGPQCLNVLAAKTHDYILKLDRLSMFRWALGRGPRENPGKFKIPDYIISALNRPHGPSITHLCLEGTPTQDIAAKLPEYNPDATQDNDWGEEGALELGPLFRQLQYIGLTMDREFDGSDRILHACRRTLKYMIVSPDAQYAWYDWENNLRLQSMRPDSLFHAVIEAQNGANMSEKKKRQHRLELQYLDLTGFSLMTDIALRQALDLTKLRTLIMISDNDEGPKDCILGLVKDPLRGETDLPNLVNLQYEGAPLKRGWERIAFLPKLKRLDAELYNSDWEYFMNIWENGVPLSGDANDGALEAIQSASALPSVDAPGSSVVDGMIDADNDTTMDDTATATAAATASSQPPAEYVKPKIGRMILAFHEPISGRRFPIASQRARVNSRREFANKLGGFGVRWIGIRERTISLPLPMPTDENLDNVVNQDADEDDDDDDEGLNDRALIARIDELKDDGTPVNMDVPSVKNLSAKGRKALQLYLDNVKADEEMNGKVDGMIKLLWKTRFNLVYPEDGLVRLVDPTEELCTCIL